jgi:hypothetical protein
MITPNINLSAWAPDADPTVPGVLADVDNLFPTARGYAPDFEFGDSAYSDITLPAEPYGVQLVKFATRTPLLMVGTAQNLYSYQGITQVDLTRASVAYTATSSGRPWRFSSFDDAAFAVSLDNPLQRTADPGGTDFSDVSAGPKAATIATNFNFMVAGGTGFGSAEAGGNAWACSAFENPTSWTADVATQAARGTLTATPGGIIRMIAFGPYIMAFKFASLYRGQYTQNPAQPWTWPVVSESIGVVGHDAVVAAEGALYWMARTGFYRSRGGAPERIGSAPWDYVMRTANTAYISLTQAQWDPTRRLVRWYMWAGVSGLDLCVAYHPDSDRWGKSTVSIEWAANNNVEIMPVLGRANTDAQIYDAPIVIAKTTHKLRSWMTTPGSSYFETGDIGEDDAARIMTRARVRYAIKPTASTATHKHRATLGDALTTGESCVLADGKHDFSQAARWHRVRVANSGAYEVLGISLEVQNSGRR